MLTDKVLDFLLASDWAGLPSRVRDHSKLCLLDVLGAMLAGFQTPVARHMINFVLANYGGSQARILVSGQRVSAVGAALVNGFSANALDVDDGYRLIKGHPGACLTPLLFPALEAAPGISGQELLSALAAGYEVAIRAGMIRHARYETYHSSGSWGAIAGAALLGKLWGLERPVIRHALGAAEYHAPIAPMMKGIATPSMGKDSIGWGCMVAMSSALMAREGFTGITPIFNDAHDPGLIDELGVRYRMLDLYFKPYTACRWGQPAVGGALKIVKEHDLHPRDIARIRVRSFAAALSLPNDHPQTTEDAQYNLAFPVAAAIWDGEVGPAQVLPPRLHDPELLVLSDKVRVELEPSYEEAFPEKAIAEVVIETKQGGSYSSGPQEAKWDPSTGSPSESELREKFLWLVSPVLGRDQARRLASLVLDLDRQERLAPLLELTVKS